MQTLDKIARQPHDLRIFTNGERRYGNRLFGNSTKITLCP